jgi:hypothetical protein
MTGWLALLRLLLELAAVAARRAERNDIERSVLDALENSHRDRVDAALAARDDVLAGRVPADEHDPNKRG